MQLLFLNINNVSHPLRSFCGFSLLKENSSTAGSWLVFPSSGSSVPTSFAFTQAGLKAHKTHYLSAWMPCSTALINLGTALLGQTLFNLCSQTDTVRHQQLGGTQFVAHHSPPSLQPLTCHSPPIWAWVSLVYIRKYRSTPGDCTTHARNRNQGHISHSSLGWVSNIPLVKIGYQLWEIFYSVVKSQLNSFVKAGTINSLIKN